MYYATQYSLNNIGSNLYTNSLAVAMAEVFAYVVTGFFIQRIPRRDFVVGMVSAATMFCVLFFLRLPNTVQTIFSALIRVFNCFTLAVLAVYTDELYPTPVRALGVGI
jgi:Na+/melibiose symporter-like transporter